MPRILTSDAGNEIVVLPADPGSAAAAAWAGRSGDATRRPRSPAKHESGKSQKQNRV